MSTCGAWARTSPRSRSTAWRCRPRPAASTAPAAINRGRAFDFNVFPAELFSRIDINKSLVASIEEGGVGGAVQMYTAGGLDSRHVAGVGSDPDWLQRPVGGDGSAVHGNLHHGEQGEDRGLHDLRGADGAQLLAGWFRHRPLAEAGRELQGERDDAEQPAAPIGVVPAPAPPGQLPARPGAPGPGELAAVPPDRQAGPRLESGALEVRGNDDQLQLLWSVPPSRHLGLQQHHPDQRHPGTRAGTDRLPLPVPSGACRCGRRAARPKTRRPSIS